MNGQSKRLNATIINIDKLYKTGMYFIQGANLNDSLGTYPSTSSGYHLISLSEDSWEGSAKLQILKGFSSDDSNIYFRNSSFNPTSQTLVWSNYQLIATIEKIKTDISTTHNGYLKFGPYLGNITLQWGEYNAAPVDEIDTIIYPISFQIFAKVSITTGFGNTGTFVPSSINDNNNGFTFKPRFSNTTAIFMDALATKYIVIGI